MATRQQIRTQSRIQINETDSGNSHFTDEQINEFIDQWQAFTATKIEHPRDTVELVTDDNDDTYTLPVDTLFLRRAYFGDKTKQNDLRPLQIISDKTLDILHPTWLEETTESRGRPVYVILKDKKTLFLYPRVSSGNSGKSLIISYVYVPSALTQEGSEPDLPIAYHDSGQFYVAHLCYNRLGDSAKSAEFLGKFQGFIKELESAVTKEAESSKEWEWQLGISL